MKIDFTKVIIIIILFLLVAFFMMNNFIKEGKATGLDEIKTYNELRNDNEVNETETTKDKDQENSTGSLLGQA